jgi:DNA replication protein DnaC
MSSATCRPTVAVARLLFQVVSDCYERRSLVITTNIEFEKWGTVLADDKCFCQSLSFMCGTVVFQPWQ